MLDDTTIDRWASERRRIACLMDLIGIVRVIVQRYQNAGGVLSWQLLREIGEEAISDIGLAARWDESQLDEMKEIMDFPPYDGNPAFRNGFNSEQIDDHVAAVLFEGLLSEKKWATLNMETLAYPSE